MTWFGGAQETAFFDLLAQALCEAFDLFGVHHWHNQVTKRLDLFLSTLIVLVVWGTSADAKPVDKPIVFEVKTTKILASLNQPFKVDDLGNNLENREHE